MNETIFNTGVYNIPEKKLNRFLRRRVRLNSNLLKHYRKKLNTLILNRETRLSFIDCFLKLNNVIYDIIGLFDIDSILIKNTNNEHYYEIKLSLIEESFGYRKFDINGKIIIPKLSQMELTNLKTLKRIDDDIDNDEDVINED